MIGSRSPCLGLLSQGAAGKKPAAKGLKEDEDRSGPIFTLVPNAKEQRVKEEKQLKVKGISVTDETFLRRWLFVLTQDVLLSHRRS